MIHTTYRIHQTCTKYNAHVLLLLNTGQGTPFMPNCTVHTAGLAASEPPIIAAAHGRCTRSSRRSRLARARRATLRCLHAAPQRRGKGPLPKAVEQAARRRVGWAIRRRRSRSSSFFLRRRKRRCSGSQLRKARLRGVSQWVEEPRLGEPRGRQPRGWPRGQGGGGGKGGGKGGGDLRQHEGSHIGGCVVDIALRSAAMSQLHMVRSRT